MDEHPTSASSVGLPTKIFFRLGAQLKNLRVCILNVLSNLLVQKKCLTKLRKILPTQVLMFKEKGSVNHSTFQWCFLLVGVWHVTKPIHETADSQSQFVVQGSK